MKDTAKRVFAGVPTVLRQHPRYWQWRRFLERARGWSRTEIETWQFNTIRDLLFAVYERTPGYRKLYDGAGFHPRDFRSLSDLARVPFTDRSLLQGRVEEFSLGGSFSRYNTTGGTTGVPLKFFLNRGLFAAETAFMRDAWALNGWKLGDVSFVLRGSYFGSDTELWTYCPYSRELTFSTGHLSSATFPLVRELVRKYRPKNLQVYPSALSLLADLKLESGAEDLEFPLILLGSETIYGWQLDKFRKAFPGSVFHAWYGHAEKSAFAPWVPGTTVYEPNPFYGLTEILNPEASSPVTAGEEGEIVTTGLFAHASPFIRYRTGDRAVLAAPQERRIYDGGVHWEHVSGRLQEVIVTLTGRYISMTGVSVHKGMFDPLREFQFVQERPGELVMHFVPLVRPFSDARRVALERELNAKLGTDVVVRLIEVEAVPRTPSKKLRYLDQRLPIKYNVG